MCPLRHARFALDLSFVSQVRTMSGTIWKYDPAAVNSEISGLQHSKVAETILDPKGGAPCRLGA
jgi:hypothetical protein